MTCHNRPGIQESPASSLQFSIPSSFSSGYFSVLHKVHTPLSASAKCTHPLSAPRLRVDICVTSKKLGCPSSAGTLGGCDRVLVGLQNALLDELIRFWPILELLLQAVGPHMLLEVFLVALKGWCGSAVGEDVACEVARVSVSGTPWQMTIESACECLLTERLADVGMVDRFAKNDTTSNKVWALRVTRTQIKGEMMAKTKSDE